MPHADLHGNTIEIDMKGKGKVTFELVRVGTVREFDTVKAALATSKAAEQSLDGLNQDLKGKLAHREETCVAADAAYTAEKEKNAEGSEQLAIMRKEVERLAELAYVQGAREGLTEREHREGIVRDFQKVSREKNDLRAELESARAELDNLTTVSVSLEETNTALEVSEKACGETREALNAVSAERDKNCAALADLKTELLKDAGDLAYGIKALIEKFTGE